MSGQSHARTARADVVGSLLRPPYLREARAGMRAGTVSDVQLRAVEDHAVIELALLLLPGAARSAPKDAAVTRIADDAINNDYLALHFNEAVKKLRGALVTCGANACSAQVRARLHRDLGVVLIAGLNRAGEGKKEFAEAGELV